MNNTGKDISVHCAVETSSQAGGPTDPVVKVTGKSFRTFDKDSGYGIRNIMFKRITFPVTKHHAGRDDRKPLELTTEEQRTRRKR